MRILHLFLTLIFPLLCFSQEIIVKGKVYDSYKNNNQIFIVKNDTLDKYKKERLFGNYDSNGNLYEKDVKQIDILLYDLPKKQEILNKLWKNKKFVTKPDSLNNFVLKARLTDSLFFKSNYHLTKSYLVSDLIKNNKIDIKLELEPCEKWPSYDGEPEELYAFVGRKTKTCYDHNTVLLYVLKYGEDLVHIKYLYDILYKTKQGNWASPLYPYFQDINKDSTYYLKPKKIDFEQPIILSYDTSNENEIKKLFPEPYCKVDNGKIFITYGYDLTDLIKIRQKNQLSSYNHLIK